MIQPLSPTWERDRRESDRVRGQRIATHSPSPGSLLSFRTSPKSLAPDPYSCPSTPPKPKLAVTSSPTIRRSRSGLPRQLPEVRGGSTRRLPPAVDVPLGLYLHIPFCRKRCKFCYFRVYTDKNARRRRDLRRGPVARDRTGQPAAGHGRAAVPLRLLRRRHAFVPERQATHVAGRSAAGEHQLGPGRRSHVRVRAGHAVRAQGAHAQASWASRG